MDRAQPTQVIVSNIPSNPTVGGLAPIQRQSNESIRSRKIQIQKNAHRTEDVEELDDAGVESIRDHDREKDQQERKEEAEEQLGEQLEERVEIESLNVPAHAQAPPPAPATVHPHLDISA